MSDGRDLLAEFLGIPPQPGDEWTILCPSPEHTDRRPSASIYVGEPMERLRGGKTYLRLPGMWTCFSCHASGRISNDKIENYEPSTDRNLQAAEDLLAEAPVRVYPESWLDLFEFPGGIHPYWLSRFNAATCRKHRLGYDFERDAGTYPLRTPTGEVLGVVRRSLDPGARIKYRYPSGIDIHRGGFLYGYAEAVQAGVEVVAIGEGALDAVACDEAGQAALAIYGSHISEAQVRLINRLYPKTIILAFDNDAAGRDATRTFLASGIECVDIRVVDLARYGVNDIADLPLVERAAALADSAPCDTLGTVS